MIGAPRSQNEQENRPMRTQKLTYEHAIYLLVILLAAAFRLAALGRSGLSESEAGLALQAYDLVRGNLHGLSPQVGYVLPSAVLMFVFGTADWIARLWPALSGILLVAMPYLLRDAIGKTAALVLAFFFAIDPGLIAVSRQASPAMVGLAFTLLALACWLSCKPVLAGVLGGLALAGGPAVWPNLLVIGLAAWASARPLGQLVPPYMLTRPGWRKLLIAAAVTLVLFSTVLFLIPGGISAPFTGLSAYLSGWASSSGISIGVLVFAVLAYQLLGFILGLGGFMTGLREKDELDKFLGVWWLAAIVVALVYPSRQAADLIWPSVPMLVLAARQMMRLLKVNRADLLPALGQAALVLLLLLLIANLVVSMPSADPSASTQIYRWGVLGIAILLIGAETYLVGWGWSRVVGFSGLAWGVTGLLVLFTISSGVDVAGLSGRPSAELWNAGPAFVESSLLRQTVKDYATWMPNPSKAPAILITGQETNALRWNLHDFSGVQVESNLAPTSKPEMVISPEKAVLAQSASYTGQAFILARAPIWNKITPAEWIDWLVYRKVKSENWNTQLVVLWVRSDLFPGAEQPKTTPNTTP